MRIPTILVSALLVSSCTLLPSTEAELNALIAEEIHVGMNIEAAREELRRLGFRNFRYTDPKLLDPNRERNWVDYRVIFNASRDYIPCGFTRMVQIVLEEDNTVAERKGFIGRTCL